MSKSDLLSTAAALAGNQFTMESSLPPSLAAAFCGLAPKTLDKKRVNGSGPKFVRISSRCVRYRVKDLIEWMEARVRTSTSDSGKEERC